MQIAIYARVSTGRHDLLPVYEPQEFIAIFSF